MTLREWLTENNLTCEDAIDDTVLDSDGVEDDDGDGFTASVVHVRTDETGTRVVEV